jgi:predicted RNA-binding Zn ribbon-like protein
MHMAAIPNAAPFSLCGGHPALDLVNTLDNRFRDSGPVELLGDYAALLRFTEQSGLLSAAQVDVLRRQVGKPEAERAVNAARELREAAASALYAGIEGSASLPADVRLLEGYFQTARTHQELVWASSSDGPKFVWEWGSSQTEADLLVWILSLQTCALLTSDKISRLRSCKSGTCRWLFLDTSKNHTRRWCDMKICGNRMKARRFQARSA